MSHDLLADLHTPLDAILRHVLAVAGLPRAGLVLDLACGPGLKLPLLAHACGPGVQLLALDHDCAAVHAACSAYRVPGVAGDALALPLRDSCCAAACCIAALGLFADPRLALCELRRVVRPAGRVLILTAMQAWATVTPWPDDLAARLCRAYADVLDTGQAALPAAADLSSEMIGQLLAAGFVLPHVRAFLPGTARHPLRSELPLLPWAALRPLLAGRLVASDLARCDQIAMTAEAELCTLAIAAQADVP